MLVIFEKPRKAVLSSSFEIHVIENPTGKVDEVVRFRSGSNVEVIGKVDDDVYIIYSKSLEESTTVGVSILEFLDEKEENNIMPSPANNHKRKVQFIEMNGEKIRITDRFVREYVVESNYCLELYRIDLEGNDVDSIMDADLYFHIIDPVNDLRISKDHFKLHHLMDKYKRWDRNEHLGTSH
ncbi:hypothetical protein Staley_11 [Bacillus phage Staley]|uniref:Uncharacterized protein n=1 Tax=Bacillus phage Staley TaxID=1406792 RepID=U5PXQ7_9CAUD|nr:hypothetical protein Staley_11 [Bacillus phage Staley]AGY48694.1 hypothetical protein Staley_11 [Bacillus phage Staley]